MAYIKTLKDNELIGGQDNTDVYPVTTSQAIYRQNPNGSKPDGVKQRLEDTLQDHEEDAKELHRKTEKLVLYLTNSEEGKDLEFDGSSTYTMNIVGKAGLETYGDEAEETLSPLNTEKPHIESYSIIISDGTINHEPDTVEESKTQVNATFSPQTPGTYTVKYSVTNNDGKKSTTKQTSSVTYLVLRKYYGFSASAPTSVADLNGSNYSHNVSSTITLPVNSSGEKFKHVYIAIPKYLLPTGKTISVRQPDALNAPFAIHEVAEITREVMGIEFSYRVFESGTTTVSEDGLIDSTVSKRLTITVS